MLKRSVWGLADQAVSSLSSLILAIMVARVSTADEVGAWAIAYAVYTFSLTVSRSVVSTTALIVRRSDDAESNRDTDSGSVSLAFLIGVAGGFLLVSTGLLFGSTVGAYFFAFGAALPVLLLQDSVRYVFIRQRRTHVTAALDVLWLSLQILLGVYFAKHFESGMAATVGWIVGALLSACVGVILMRSLPTARDAGVFLRRHFRSSAKLLLDSVLNAGTSSLLPMLLGATLGLSATGHFRGALTLLGVAGIVVMGLTPIATVEVLPRVQSARFTTRFLVFWSFAIAGTGVFLWIGLYFLPDSVGTELLGDTWYGAKTIIFAMSLQVIMRGPVTGVPVVLRAAHELNAVIRLRLLHGLSSLTTTMAGAFISGLPGAAWGWAFSSVIGAVFALVAYSRYLRKASGVL